MLSGARVDGQLVSRARPNSPNVPHCLTCGSIVVKRHSYWDVPDQWKDR
jgi:hypothetical protein